jgi:hypothetical protein
MQNQVLQPGDRVILWLRPEGDGSFGSAVEREGTIDAISPNDTITVDLDGAGSIVCGPIVHPIEIIEDEGERPTILGELNSQAADTFRRLVSRAKSSARSHLWVFGPHRANATRAAG